MRRVKMLCLAVIASFVPTVAHAIEPLGIAVSENKIYVYWGPLKDGPEGYELQRAKGDGKFQRAAPVQRISDVTEANRVLHSAPDALSRALTLDEHFEERATDNPGVDQGMALASVGYAVVRGYGYLDTDVRRRTQYRYRLVRVAPGGIIIVAEGAADTARPTIPPEVAAIAAIENDQPVLTWTAAAHVRYHVQRADKPAGPYTRLTLMPLPALGADQPMRYDDASAVLDGRRYSYQVVAYSLLDQPGTVAKPVTVTIPDRTPPEPPAELDVENRPAAVMLRWKVSPESDVAGYHLYRREVDRSRAGAAEWTRITSALLTPATVTFEDRAVDPGRIYQFEISASDRTGNESRHSLPVLGLPRDVLPPARPDGLGAKAGDNGQVGLTWKANTDTDLYAYRIYRAADDGELSFVRELPVKELRHGPSISHAEKLDPLSEATYRYAVSAVDATENESPMSDAVSVRLPDRVPPQPPILLGLQAEQGAITLAWVPTPAIDVAGYYVYRGEDKNKLTRVTSEPLSPDVLSYRDEKAKAGTVFFYAISAVDQSGNEGSLSEVQSSVTYVESAPVAPSGLKLDAAVKPWHLTWQAPPEARGFIVYVAGEQDGDYRQLGTLVTARAIEVPIPPASTHWYRIQAVYGAGSVSTLSEPVAVAPPGERIR